MPAVDLARLKIQAAKLVENFNQPAAFLRELHDLLDFYADRTMRPGRIASPVTVLPNYRTPSAVLRLLESELAAYATTHADKTLALADVLWEDQHLETRLLAAALIGRVPPNHPGLIARINPWAEETREPNVRQALLNASLARMRNEMPASLLKLISSWLEPANSKRWSNGIRALIPLLAELDFDNLPPVFHMIQPVIEIAPPALQVDLADLLSALHRASPIETAYFLRQIITLSPNPQTAIMLRRILPALPVPLQEGLREHLRVIR
jgi:hypothetical protein